MIFYGFVLVPDNVSNDLLNDCLIVVSNADQFKSAVQDAVAGDIIEVVDGTYDTGGDEYFSDEIRIKPMKYWMVGPYAEENVSAIEQNKIGELSKSPLIKIVPNPFNSRTKFIFSLDIPQTVTLKIYDISGKHISSLSDKHFSAGEHYIDWNAENYATGMYIYRFNWGENYSHGWLMLLKWTNRSFINIES